MIALATSLELKNNVIFENGKAVLSNKDFDKGTKGLTEGVDEGAYVTLHLGSGDYSFQVKEQ